MGATASRSRLVRIYGYSKLAREPVLDRRTFDTIFFRDLSWDVQVTPSHFNEGLADYFLVSVRIDWTFMDRLDSVLDTDISIEILDKTGETVFREESSRRTLEADRCLILALSRSELEASSCVHNDSFTVRCTLSKQATKLCRFFKSKLAVLEPQVAMAGSHTLTIGSLSKLNAALRPGESTRSTHFAVGGCRWYFKFNPGGLFRLVRASKDKTPTAAEFSFELEGVVKFESQKMTHTFDRANPQYLFKYRLEPSTSAMNDRLVVRCCLAVVMVEKPSLPPAATIPTATTPRTESVLTPLLSAMYD